MRTLSFLVIDKFSFLSEFFFITNRKLVKELKFENPFSNIILDSIEV